MAFSAASRQPDYECLQRHYLMCLADPRHGLVSGTPTSNPTDCWNRSVEIVTGVRPAGAADVTVVRDTCSPAAPPPTLRLAVGQLQLA